MLKQKRSKNYLLVLVAVFTILIGSSVFATDYNYPSITSIVSAEASSGNNYYTVEWSQQDNIIYLTFYTMNTNCYYHSGNNYFIFANNYTSPNNGTSWTNVGSGSYNTTSSNYTFLRANFNVMNNDNSSIYFAQTDGIILQSISISGNNSVTISGSNNTSQLTATGHYSDTTTAPITNDCTWTSSNTSIATVSSAGVVTGITAGTCYITATKDGITSSNYSITVTDPDAYQGNRAILEITMTNGKIKEYDMEIEKIQDFLDWYDTRAGGSGKAYYIIRKANNIKPFLSRRDYIAFDKILDFEVKDYTDTE